MSVNELKTEINNLYQNSKKKNEEIIKEGIKKIKVNNEELLDSIKLSRHKSIIPKDHNLINMENVLKFKSIIKNEIILLKTLTDKNSEELIDIYHKELKLPYTKDLKNAVNKCGVILDDNYTEKTKREYEHCIKGLYLDKVNEYENINYLILKEVAKWIARYNEYMERYTKLTEKNKKVYDTKRKKLYSVIQSYDKNTKEYDVLLKYFNDFAKL